MLRDARSLRIPELLLEGSLRGCGDAAAVEREVADRPEVVEALEVVEGVPGEHEGGEAPAAQVLDAGDLVLREPEVSQLPQAIEALDDPDPVAIEVQVRELPSSPSMRSTWFSER